VASLPSDCRDVAPLIILRLKTFHRGILLQCTRIQGKKLSRLKNDLTYMLVQTVNMPSKVTERHNDKGMHTEIPRQRVSLPEFQEKLLMKKIHPRQAN